jgi:hypothetical protein
VVSDAQQLVETRSRILPQPAAHFGPCNTCDIKTRRGFVCCALHQHGRVCTARHGSSPAEKPKTPHAH